MAVARPHLIIPAAGDRHNFAPRGGGGKASHPAVVDNRTVNSARILGELRAIVDEAIVSPDMDAGRVPLSVRAGTGWGVSGSLPSSRRNDVLSTVGFGEKARLNVALDPESLHSFESAAQENDRIWMMSLASTKADRWRPNLPPSA